MQKAFAAAGLTVLAGYDCPAAASDAALLLEDLCAALGGKTPYYICLLYTSGHAEWYEAADRG